MELWGDIFRSTNGTALTFSGRRVGKTVAGKKK